ncbi:pyridoxal-phosphate dependent enzyme [Bacteroidota bacterium]
MKLKILDNIPSKNDIKESKYIISDYAHETPVLTCNSINQIAGTQLYFKCENFQKVGAFKFRGAINTIMRLEEDELSKGVATHSSGNHAQALALAARIAGTTASIVMPKNAPEIKIEAVKQYGANITFCEPTLAAREKTLAEIIDKTGAWFIHPYNDYNVIAGQATCALELINQVNEIDAIITPVGGGGLLSGTLLTAKHFSKCIKVFAGEPEGAKDAYLSLKNSELIPSINPDTIADGLLTSLGDKTYPIISENIEEILLVNDEEIVLAMRLLWERMKIIVEPSGAVPLAAILREKHKFRNKNVGLILSGGNIDLNKLPFS